jgi:hypothetical protein
MALDVQEVQLYGPADVLINGVTVGHTTMEGIKVKRTPKIAEAKVSKFGDTAVKKWQDGEKLEVEFTLAQSNFGLLANALPSATLVTDGSGNQKLTFGKIAGTPLDAVELVLQPFVAANTPTYDLTIPKAVSIGDFSVDYIGEKFNGFHCKFEGLVDESASDGALLFTLGDASITQNAVAPTFTVVPTDNATPTAPANIVWTFSKDLNADTIQDYESALPSTVIVMKTPSGAGQTGLEYAGHATLSNNGAATTLTWTPDVAFQSGQVYMWILQNIKSLDGNDLPFNAGNFTPV